MPGLGNAGGGGGREHILQLQLLNLGSISGAMEGFEAG